MRLNDEGGHQGEIPRCLLFQGSLQQGLDRQREGGALWDGGCRTEGAEVRGSEKAATSVGSRRGCGMPTGQVGWGEVTKNCEGQAESSGLGRLKPFFFCGFINVCDEQTSHLSIL